MAAWRPAAATCSINWNASITPGSGRGCAASPCWNRNAGSATKPPANSASTSPVWLPTHPASPAPSAPTGPSRTACTGPWMSASTTTRCAPAPRPRPIIWRCSNTLPSTLSGSIRSNGKAASKPADSSPLPQTYTALNCSDSYDVHAIALHFGSSQNLLVQTLYLLLVLLDVLQEFALPLQRQQVVEHRILR